MDHPRRIRCVAYHRIPDEEFPDRTALKFGPRSTRCMLTGYTESTKLWKLWDLPKQRALRSTDVILAESENAMEVTSDKNTSSSFFLNEHLSLESDENPPNGPRIANEPEAQHEELLHQVGKDLRRLTSSEACLAVYAHIAHYLDRSEFNPLAFHEGMKSPEKSIDRCNSK